MSGLYYPKVYAQGAYVGSKATTGTLTGVTLTAAYQSEAAGHPTKSFATGSNVKVTLDIAYTTGTGETASKLGLMVETSQDTLNWFQLVNETVSTGTSTLNAREFQFAGGAGATTYKFSLPLDNFYKNMRISFKEIGVVTNFGNVYCEGTQAGL